MDDGPRWLPAACRRGAGRALLGALALLVAGVGPAPAGPIDGTPPYPESARLARMELDWATLRRQAWGSDNWHTTWAKDGRVYTSWGDGGGFGTDADVLAYVSLGVARITGGSSATARGVNLAGGLGPVLAPCFPHLPGNILDKTQRPGRVYPCRGRSTHGKSRSLLALGDHLYLHLLPGSGAKGYAEARLHRAPLGTNAWERAAWAFTPTGPYPVIGPAFVQAGRNHRDAPDGWVYAYAIRYAPTVATGPSYSLQKGPEGGEITLMRAARGADLMARASWAFFAGTGPDGRPLWNGDQALARSVFVDPNGVGWNASATYVKALGRYLLLTTNTRTRSGRLGVYESSRPWGPWRTVFYSTVANPALDVPPTAHFFSFLANSFSADGTRFTLTFFGKRPIDAFVTVDGRFTLGTP